MKFTYIVRRSSIIRGDSKYHRKMNVLRMVRVVPRKLLLICPKQTVSADNSCV